MRPLVVAFTLMASVSGAQSIPQKTPAMDAPDFKTTVEFMGRMVGPEDREVVPGELNGAPLHSQNPGRSMTIVSNRHMSMVLVTGQTQKNGYPELLYTIGGDDGRHE